MFTNADFVISDPCGPYLYNRLAHFSSLDPKIWPIRHLEHLKAIMLVGYPPRVTIYEVSNVQTKIVFNNVDFVISDPRGP